MRETATVTSHYAPDVEDVRRWMEKMIKAMRLVELVAAIIALVTRMRDLNTELTKRLADARRKRPRSEKLRRVDGQLALAFGPVIPLREETDSEPAPPSSPTGDGAEPSGGRPNRNRAAHPGRAALPSHLERVTEVNEVPPELRQCPLCGQTMTVVSHTACEVLDVRPAELCVVRRLRRDRRLPQRRHDRVGAAPACDRRARQARRHTRRRVAG